MTLLAIIVILFLISVIAVVWKTKQLDVDPLQDALQMLVAELISNDNTPDAQRRFSEVAAAYFHRFHLERQPIPMLRVRLLHALATWLNRVPTQKFKEVERYLTHWEMPHFTPPQQQALPNQKTEEQHGPADVFVSYAREDQNGVRIVVARLEASGFSVWWDDGIHAGTPKFKSD